MVYKRADCTLESVRMCHKVHIPENHHPRTKTSNQLAHWCEFRIPSNGYE